MKANREFTRVELRAVSWIRQRHGLFDFRSETHQERHHFKACNYTLQIPNHNKSIYYFFHQHKNSDILKFKIQRRKELASQMETRNDLIDYRLVGGIQLFNEYKNMKSKIKMKVVDAQDIYLTKCRQVKQEQIYRHGIYWVVRSFGKRGFVLEKDQTILLGKTSLRIDELVATPGNQDFKHLIKQQILNLDELIEESKIQNHSHMTDDTVRCRFCYGNEQENKFLINPCKCKGTQRYIHVDCLRDWIATKIQKIKMDCNQDNMKMVDNQCCQVCKAKLPKVIIKNGVQYNLIKFIEQRSAFIALVPSIGEEHLEQQVYLTMQEGKQIKLGRSEDNNVYFGDMTVSRNHCQIELKDDKFIIRDIESKYGTLIKDPHKEVVLGKNLTAIQIYSTIFCFKIQQNAY